MPDEILSLLIYSESESEVTTYKYDKNIRIEIRCKSNTNNDISIGSLVFLEHKEEELQLNIGANIPNSIMECLLEEIKSKNSNKFKIELEISMYTDGIAVYMNKENTIEIQINSIIV